MGKAHKGSSERGGRTKVKMRKWKLMPAVLCILTMLTGCSPDLSETAAAVQVDGDVIRVGTQLEIEKPDGSLSLLDNKEALAADGLYYAAWSMGDAAPYENSDGDTVDLYDAQLYLLLSECADSEDAQEARSSWLDAARQNYEVSKEEEITCNGQSYTCLHYKCVSEDNPYDRGVSAFAVSGKNAVCIELTCQEAFEGDLQSILTGFLDGCHYK